jgi:hypothetical protein
MTITQLQCCSHYEETKTVNATNIKFIKVPNEKKKRIIMVAGNFACRKRIEIN